MHPLVLLALSAAADISAPPADAAFQCQPADSWYFQLSFWKEPPAQIANLAGLGPRQATSAHAMATQPTWSVDSVKPKAVVIDLPSGRVRLRLAEFVDGFVEDARGQLVALVCLGKNQVSLVGLDGTLRWRQSLQPGGDSVAAIADGGHLYLATFGRILTGSQLVSLRLSDGALEWRAEVLQPWTAAQYRHDVQLTLNGQVLTLTGRALGGCYQQRFSTTNGKRLLSRVFPD